MSTMDTPSPSDSATLFQDWNEGVPDGATYQFDRMHFPYPLAPLAMSALSTAIVEGGTQGFRELGFPVRSWHVIWRNHYFYDNQEMVEFSSETEAKQVAAAIQATMQREAGRLLELWNDMLPEIRENLGTLEHLTGQVPSADNVSVLIDEAFAAFADLWRLHFKVTVPKSVAMQVFDEFYAEVFGGGEEDGHPLLAGQLNESVKASFGLSDLAGRARSLGVASTILDHDVGEALEVLTTTAAGRAFLDDLDIYLVTYGLRQDLLDLATPTWRERPALALMNIRNYLRTGLDARAHHAEIEDRASQAREQARTELAQYPQAVRGQFEVMLAMGAAASFLQEEHNFYIDQMSIAQLHLFFVAVGQRLVDAAVIEVSNDVFMLTPNEVRSGLKTPTPLGDTVAVRQRELDAAQSLTPPPFIGSPPSTPWSTATPGARSTVRFYGLATPASDDPDRVVGNPGARGTATGPARVIWTLEEAHALQPGEILVTVTTMPPWSPLFAVAAGVVTETGGPLSHCAIVAREYGIPAVVGATDATRRITNGQRISIDGATGIVELHG